MTIRVTLYNTNDKPLAAGTEIELLGDGQVIAKATAEAGGVVTFDADTGSVGRLAVRLAAPPAGNKTK